MTVRLATENDLREVAALGRAAVKGADAKYIDFDAMPDILRDYMRMPGMRFVVDDIDGSIVSALLGTVAPYPWSRDAELAYVLLWWSSGNGNGGSVFRAFREWAAANGADLIMAAARDKRANRIYERYGMTAVETNHMGAI